MMFMRMMLALCVSTYLAASTWAAGCQRCLRYLPKGQELCERCRGSAAGAWKAAPGRPRVPVRAAPVAPQRKAGTRKHSPAAPSRVAKKPAPGNAVEIVHKVVAAREAYESNLKQLVELYIAQGDKFRLERAREELGALRRIPKYGYLGLADVLGHLEPTKDIAEANKLYEDAMAYRKYPSLPILGKKLNYTQTARLRFEELIRKYPTSDKVDDAAYRLGEIYSGWGLKDYRRAVQFFEKCFEWNPRTEHPARYRAGLLCEDKLHDYTKAVELYQLTVRQSSIEGNRHRAQKRLHLLRKRGY